MCFQSFQLYHLCYLGTDVEEVETNFESILEENIENATDKKYVCKEYDVCLISGLTQNSQFIS